MQFFETRCNFAFTSLYVNARESVCDIWQTVSIGAAVIARRVVVVVDVSPCVACKSIADMQ